MALARARSRRASPPPAAPSRSPTPAAPSRSPNDARHCAPHRPGQAHRSLDCQRRRPLPRIPQACAARTSPPRPVTACAEPKCRPPVHTLSTPKQAAPGCGVWVWVGSTRAAVLAERPGARRTLHPRARGAGQLALPALRPPVSARTWLYFHMYTAELAPSPSAPIGHPPEFKPALGWFGWPLSVTIKLASGLVGENFPIIEKPPS